jgi:hypothetical protein
MWLNSLLRWKSDAQRTRRDRERRPQRHQRPRFVPRLEALEFRTLPSTFPVLNLADSGAGSLRQAILDANSTPGDDAITFEVTGTINLARALPNLSSNIDIQGPGADALIVRRATGGNYSIFTVARGATVVLSGLTVTNGYTGQGAGISNGGTLTLNDVSVSRNYADRGGGIYNGGTLTVSDSTISGNGGAGIVNPQGATLTLSRSTLTGNVSSGGGIANGGTLTVSDSTFSGNIASQDLEAYGGGVYNGQGATAVISNSTFSRNTAFSVFTPSYGGGIYNYGTLTLSNSTLSGNSAEGDSGPYGGGIYNRGGTLTISNSTVTGNSAYDGGGIAGLNLNMRNTIVAGNMAFFGAPDVGGRLTSSGYNVIGNTQYGSGFDDTDLLNVDPLLGPLQDNGGPTLTHALLPGSPALDAGDPAQLGVSDQRGVVRSDGVNIGAYQASASAFVLTAPATVLAGVPFDVTVTAVDPFGQVALGYTGTVTFGTTDPDAGVVLPADYTFSAADLGMHTFSGACTLLTPCDQTLTADDRDGGFGASAVVTVDGGGSAPARHRRADDAQQLAAVAKVRALNPSPGDAVFGEPAASLEKV